MLDSQISMPRKAQTTQQTVMVVFQPPVLIVHGVAAGTNVFTPLRHADRKSRNKVGIREIDRVLEFLSVRALVVTHHERPRWHEAEMHSVEGHYLGSCIAEHCERASGEGSLDRRQRVSPHDGALPLAHSRELLRLAQRDLREIDALDQHASREQPAPMICGCGRPVCVGVTSRKTPDWISGGLAQRDD